MTHALVRFFSNFNQPLYVLWAHKGSRQANIHRRLRIHRNVFTGQKHNYWNCCMTRNIIMTNTEFFLMSDLTQMTLFKVCQKPLEKSADWLIWTHKSLDSVDIFSKIKAFCIAVHLQFTLPSENPSNHKNVWPHDKTLSSQVCWSLVYVSVALCPSLIQNQIAYRSSIFMSVISRTQLKNCFTKTIAIDQMTLAMSNQNIRWISKIFQAQQLHCYQIERIDADHYLIYI